MPTSSEPPRLPFETNALALVRAELEAIPVETLLPVNVDVTSAAMIVIGAASELRTHRAALFARCKAEHVMLVDRLELVARAAAAAQSAHRLVEKGEDVTTLSGELCVVRTTLLAEARSLIVRKLLRASTTRSLVGGRGHKAICLDVMQLVTALEAGWSTVEGQTWLTLAYLHRAEATTHALMAAVAERDQAARSPSAELRQRAFTLMATTYDEVRRMVAYLRWHEGDAERIAPSFLAHAHRRRRTTPKTAPTVEAVETVDVRATAPSVPSALITPAPAL